MILRVAFIFKSCKMDSSVRHTQAQMATFLRAVVSHLEPVTPGSVRTYRCVSAICEVELKSEAAAYVKKQTRMLERRLAAASAGLPGRSFETTIIVGLGRDGGRL